MEVSQETNQNSNITGNNQVIQKKLEQIEKRKIKKKKISQEAFLLLSVCLITLFISLMMIVVVEGNSMNPSLFPGDMLLVLKNPKQYTSNDVVLVKKKAVDRIWIKRIIGVPGDTVSFTYNGDTQELEITIGQKVIPIPIRNQDGITIEPTDLEKAEKELNQNLQMSGIDTLTGTQTDKDAYIKALKKLYIDEQIPIYSLDQNVQDALKHGQEQTQVDLKMSLPDHSEDETKLIDADAISDYIRTQIVGKVESRANTVTSTLASRYSSQSETLESYQADLSTFNPLQRVNQDAVKSQYSEMRKNNSELQDSISKDYALKTEYISSLLQTTQKNVDTLRQSVVDTEEESKNTIETGLKAAKNTKTITSEENQALLYAFTTKLPNTKVGDLENTTAYQFMVNPLLVTQDSVEKATVQENNAVVNTENKKNQTEKDYGIILLVLIGICVLSIGGAVMYRNKRRQKVSSPFDE